ncbi:MAG: lipopolysaccharide heptosyltransferase II [Deltaproteobacteria bacterium]
MPEMHPLAMEKVRQPVEQPLPFEVSQRFARLQISRRFTRDPEVVRRVLVRTPNWVGDAIMSLPVLTGLKRLFPLSEITVLAVPRVASLFTAQRGVMEIIRYPSGRGKWQVLWEMRGHYDVALALPNSMEAALGLWLVGVPSRVGYNTDARRPFLKEAVSGRRHLNGLHTVFYFLGLLKALGGLATFTPPTLYLESEEIDSAAQFLAEVDLPGNGPWIGMSPGATYGPAKRWPPERFAALGRALQQEFGARLLLLGGNQERPVADQFKKHLKEPVVDLVGRTSLRQALGVLSQIRVLVTNDSGLMHAAAALSVPQVSLFGSTDPVATGPFSPLATVIHHPLPCSPCFKRTCEMGYPCLTAISVDEVLAATRNRLEAGP